MLSGRSTLLALFVGLFVWLAAGALVGGGDQAVAGTPTSGCGSGCGAPKPPTTCCAAPTPPVKPPTTVCCQPNHNVMTPGLNVYVAPSIVVNANLNASVNNSINVNAQNNASSINTANASGYATAYGTATANAFNNASASASGNATASGGSSATGYGTGFGYGACCGGGGQQFYSPPMATGMIQGLVVENQQVPTTRRVAYQDTRSRTRRVVIQAFCLDDRDVPHPASQVTPDRDIDDAYDGELYRCLAGTRLQYVIAEYSGRVAFDGGQTVVCAKNESLYHSSGGREGNLSCRPQKAARDCNERSLLRRFGAGVKILTIVSRETFTAYREETVMQASSQTVITTMSLDGGVGGVAF